MRRTLPRLTRLALAALLGAANLLGGCATMGELARSAVQKPHLTFKAVEVTAVDFDGATLAFDFTLQNPNAFGLSLAGVSYGLQVEGRPVVSGKVPGGLKIPAEGTVPVRFTARLPFAEVPRLVERVLQGGRLEYTLAGQVDVETPIGVLDLPVSHTGHVDLPMLPAFRIAGARVRLSSLTEVEVELTLAIDNRNAFPLPAGELQYQLAIGGEVVATVDGQALAAIPAHAEGRVVVPVRLSLAGAGKALGAVMRGGTADVRVVGQAKVGALPVPLDLQGKASAR